MSLNTQLLETSFAELRQQEATFTSCFYDTLFSDFPEVTPLFKATHMDEQAKKLFASLVLVVGNLSKPDVLGNALKGLGTRHVQYGVLPKHYPMVGSALLKAMSTTLKDRWSPDIEGAWTEAYSAITSVMLDGTDYPEAVLTPEAPSAERSS